MFLLYILVVIILVSIFYEDVRHRQVHAIFFLLLSVLLFVDALSRRSGYEMLASTGTNFIMLASMLVLTWLYFKVRKPGTKISEMLGLGDVLMLLGISVWFQPTHYILFVVLSLLASLILHIACRMAVHAYRADSSVPLAGFVALCLIPLIVANSFQL